MTSFSPPIPPQAGSNIEMAERVASLETEIEHLATKADIASLESKISDMETRLTWRFFSAALALFGTMAALGITAIIRLGG